jgi:hypothetical protein
VRLTDADVDKNNDEELLHGILTSGSPIFSHGIFKKKFYIKCQIYSRETNILDLFAIF